MESVPRVVYTKEFKEESVKMVTQAWPQHEENISSPLLTSGVSVAYEQGSGTTMT